MKRNIINNILNMLKKSNDNNLKSYFAQDYAIVIKLYRVFLLLFSLLLSIYL